MADFIIKDLKEAVPLLPKFSEIQEYGRISREGCQAFLSRVALYEGTWQKSRGNVERGKELLDIAAKEMCIRDRRNTDRKSPSIS